MNPIPTTPEQWAAIVPNETDRAVTESWEEWCPDLDVKGCNADDWDRLAAASRIAEHERCVERLADHLRDRNDPMRSTRELCIAEARRILEDVAEPAGPA